MNQKPPKTSWCLWLAAVAIAGALPITTRAADPLPTLETKDKVQARVGTFTGGSTFTVNRSGHTGLAGDYAADFGNRTGPVHVSDAKFLNELSKNDEMSFAFWLKKPGIEAGSTFWANSPSSTSGGTADQRGYQAHVPWSDGNLYFDTAGCCDASTQRINANIDTFAGYTGDASWWSNWHHFVFQKKLSTKEIWIDGQLFLTGDNTVALPTDFTDMYIGASSPGVNLISGVLDDFAIFGTALSEATIGALFAGTLPSALAATNKLTAYWDFNDSPGEGTFVSITPAADSANADPNLIQIVHTDGVTPWETNSITLKVDGAVVTPTFVRDGLKATVSYVPSPIFTGQTTHKVSLTYPGVGGATATLEWVFIVGTYTKDTVKSSVGTFLGGSAFSTDAGGRTGKAGDRAANFGGGTGPVHVGDAKFLNDLSKNDEMSFAFWLKKPGIEAGSTFWANSASSSADLRGFQAHVPWSDSIIYFDTAGCCDAGTQRISANIDTFPGYTGAVSWWADWHYFVFQKKLSTKEIWIDGQLFLTAESTAPLPTDFTDLYLGATAPGVNLISGLIDDFAIFGTALSEATIGSLFSGTLPSALPASNKLAAYWKFDDFPATGFFTAIMPTPNSTNAAPDFVGVIHSDGTVVWDQSKVSLKVDGAPVTFTFVKNGSATTVGYVPSPSFIAGSSHQAVLTYPGEGGAQEVLEWQFSIGTFPVISQDLWTAAGTVDTTKPGLKARVWQVDQPGSNSLVTRTHRAEQELAGIIGPNVADLTGATNGVFSIDMVNWNQDYATAEIGDFQTTSTPSRKDTAIPGIPGTGTQPNDSIAAEIITYIDFATAGFYSMGVNSDDGFKVAVTDTPPTNNLALVVTGAASAAGTYAALSGPTTTSKQFAAPVSGRLVYMDPTEGCEAAVNAAELKGNIALVDRGTCEFSAKIKAAKDAGAIACVVVNNRALDNAEGIFPIEMSVGAAGFQDLPAVMISMPDGDKIKTGLASGLTASLSPDLTPALGEFDAGRGSADSIFSFIVPTAGVYPFRLVWYEGGGGANVEWFTVTRSGEKILINDTANTSALKAYRARTAIPQTRPTISLSAQGGNVTITFTGALQAADQLTGPWTDVNATSPYTTAASGAKQFFRAKK